MDTYDFLAPAELFCPTGRSAKSPLCFHRFETSAQAIKFAIEDLSATHLGGTVLEVNEVRFDAMGIQQLYESGDFPLPRARISAIPAANEAKHASGAARKLFGRVSQTSANL